MTIKTFEELVIEARKLFPNRVRRHTTGYLEDGKVIRRLNKGFTITVDTFPTEGFYGRDDIEIDFLYETIAKKTGYYINIDTNSYDHMEDVLFKPVQDIMVLYRFIKVLKELQK